MKKRVAVWALIFSIAISVLMMPSCSENAPALEDVKDRFVYLIEGSKRINTLFFGSGLPIYDRDDTLVKEMGVYYDDDYTAYNRVTENAGYFSIDHIKDEAEKIYSKGYLDAIYETAFEGYLTGSASAYIRFFETTEWLLQNREAADFGLSERIYDYSTMKIVKPSSDKYINITIESYTLENSKRKTVSLSFIYERGNWYLDTPTY